MAETVVCRQLFEIVRMRIPIEIEQIGLQYLFFARSSINFSGGKITKLPSAEHRGLSKSKARIVSWKMDLPNESEESKRVFPK